MDVKPKEAYCLTPSRHSVNCSYYHHYSYHKLVTRVAFTTFNNQAAEF